MNRYKIMYSKTGHEYRQEEEFNSTEEEFPEKAVEIITRLARFEGFKLLDISIWWHNDGDYSVRHDACGWMDVGRDDLLTVIKKLLSQIKVT